MSHKRRATSRPVSGSLRSPAGTNQVSGLNCPPALRHSSAVFAVSLAREISEAGQGQLTELFNNVKSKANNEGAAQSEAAPQKCIRLVADVGGQSNNNNDEKGRLMSSACLPARRSSCRLSWPIENGAESIISLSPISSGALDCDHLAPLLMRELGLLKTQFKFKILCPLSIKITFTTPCLQWRLLSR